MSEPINFRRVKFEWKVKHLLTEIKAETRPFTLSGTKCKFSLKRFGSGESQLATVELSRMNDTQLNEIRVKVFIEDKNQEPLFPFDVIHKYKTSVMWWRSISELRQNAEKFLTDGVATFICEVAAEASSKDTIENEKSSRPSVSESTTGLLEKLSVDLLHLLVDHAQSDVTLKCGERSFPAHKVILSARSQYFSAMFRSDMAESRTGVISIPDMDATVLEKFLQYIYSGKLPDLSVDSALALCVAADKYGMEFLMKVCVKFIDENLTRENACKMLVFADAHGFKDLKDSAMRFIMIAELPLSEEIWLEFQKEHLELACEVLRQAYQEKCTSERPR